MKGWFCPKHGLVCWDKDDVELITWHRIMAGCYEILEKKEVKRERRKK